MKHLVLLMGALATGLYGASAATMALWNFNSPVPDANAATGTTAPYFGAGTALLVGGVSATFTDPAGSSDPAADNSNWRITTWPAQGTQNKQNGVRFNVPTVGYRNVTLSWDLRNSNTASKYARLQYTTNGTDFIDFQLITMPAEAWVNGQSASFVGVPGVENNPNFAVRFVTEFESTALYPNPGSPAYIPCNPTSTYGAGGTLRFDMVLFSGDSTITSFSVLSYNILGNGASGWTLASPNVQAVGRQLAYLQPDIIGFQEVPEDFRLQMTNFVRSYLPDFYVAIGSSTGGGERSAVASRYPVVRSQSWLVNQDLTSFGYAGDFTRDLFEAQIAIPGFAQPLHVFTTHLKAFADQTSATRRGAEARCISNFFVTTYQATNALRPCVLVGDMNEDIYEPRQYEQDAIGTLTSTPTGLKLTEPRNPVTNDDDTWSAQNANPSIRFDYVLPNGILFSNVVSQQVFRSDKVSPPVPPILATDSATASDHYPVLLVFNSSYATPFISAFAHQTILANTSTTNIAFTIGDSQTNPTNLTVSVYSAHPALVPPSGITLGGAGANRTLRLTPAAGQAGASWITVAVSDGALSASNSFMLKVRRPELITLWDFNSNPPDGNTSTGTLVPAIGAGTATSVGTATNSLNSNVSPVSFDPNLTDNSKWRLGEFPAQSTGNKTSGAQFRVSTAGYRNIALSWDHYNSGTGSRYWRLQYTLNGVNFTDTSFVYTNPVDVTWFPTGASFTAIPGANNNPNFGIRIVSEWESTATGQGSNQYIGTREDRAYTTAGTLWLDMVTFSAEVSQPTLAIRRTGDGVELSWPAAPADFTLQTTSNLSPADWQAFGQSPTTTNGTNYITIPNVDDVRFFRLAN